MKVNQKVAFILKEVLTVPEKMEPGVFYYSEVYESASHLCACGCGQEWPVPIKPGQWEVQTKEPLTINPSFQHRFGCKSHYIFKDGFALIF